VERNDRGPNEGLIGVRGSRYELGTPALVLDLEAMEANIATMAHHADTHDYAVRPVAKIHKSIEVARRQVAAGGIGACCSTLAEAEVMVDGGISDVMLFTSVVTAPKLERLAALNARSDGLIVVADHAANIAQLEEAARRSSRPLRVLIDIEVGGGRTGVAGADSVVGLARIVDGSDWLEYAGVQGYSGAHMTIVDFETRRRRGHQILEPLLVAVDRLHSEGLEPPIVSGSGTGTHDIDHELGVFTEVQAGTYVFMDGNYRDVVMRRDQTHPFLPALAVRTTVISDAQPGFVVTDAGIKEIDVIFGSDHPVILGGAPSGSSYSVIGDDMGRIDFARPADGLAVGDRVDLMPPHCYQTVCMYSNYHVVAGDDLVDIWPVDALASW